MAYLKSDFLTLCPEKLENRKLLIDLRERINGIKIEDLPLQLLKKSATLCREIVEDMTQKQVEEVIDDKISIYKYLNSKPEKEFVYELPEHRATKYLINYMKDTFAKNAPNAKYKIIIKKCRV